MSTGQTDRQTDGRTSDRYITLSAINAASVITLSKVYWVAGYIVRRYTHLSTNCGSILLITDTPNLGLRRHALYLKYRPIFLVLNHRLERVELNPQSSLDVSGLSHFADLLQQTVLGVGQLTLEVARSCCRCKFLVVQRHLQLLVALIRSGQLSTTVYGVPRHQLRY